MKIRFHLEWWVFVARYSYGTHSTGFCPYFSKQVKFRKKSWFLYIKMAPGCLLLLLNPSNLSKMEFFRDTLSTYLSRRWGLRKWSIFKYFIFSGKYGEKAFQRRVARPYTIKTRVSCLNWNFFEKSHSQPNASKCMKSCRIGISSQLCEEPQKRDLVAQSWEGAQNVRKDPYFSFRIK